MNAQALPLPPDAGQFVDVRAVYVPGYEVEVVLPNSDIYVTVHLDAHVRSDVEGEFLDGGEIYGATIYGNFLDLPSLKTFVGHVNWREFEKDAWEEFTELRPWA